MATKIAFVNNKGGSGKTTSLVNVAGALSNKYPDKKILVIDGDAQGNAARSFNVNFKELDNTIYDVFMGNITADKPIINAYENIDIIPANTDMNYLEFDMMEVYKRTLNRNMYNFYMDIIQDDTIDNEMSEHDFTQLIPKELTLNHTYFNMLDGKLDGVDKLYDFILFDTPPEIKAVTSSILAICDYVVIPYEPDMYSADGILNIVNRIKGIQNSLNPKLKIAGLLCTKFKKQTLLHSDVINDVLMFCMSNKIHHFPTKIANSIRYAHSTAYKGIPITMSDPKNDYSKAYIDVTQELIDVINERGND